jgi:hypothetical protein
VLGSHSGTGVAFGRENNNHLVDLAPADGVFREGIECPYPGCGYVTDSATPLVNCIGDPIETIGGLGRFSSGDM